MEEVTIRFACPHCRGVLRARGTLAGRWGKCKCGERIAIPFKSDATIPVAVVAGSENHEAVSKEYAAIEEICSICQCTIASGDPRTTCNRCGLPFHQDCWQENRGCSAYGCGNVDVLKAAPDIQIADLPPILPVGVPSPMPGSFLAAQPARTDQSEFPWEYPLLAASAISVLLSAFSYGIPSLLIGTVNAIYLASDSTRRGSGLAVVSLIVAAIGFVGGALISRKFYGL
jgi:hypothetical protein